MAAASGFCGCIENLRIILASDALSASCSRRKSSAHSQCSALPRSPWRAQRPASWRSRRREALSWQLSTCSPPASATEASSRMSVPRPAMLVATVTLPGWPAAATMQGLVVALLGVEYLMGDGRRVEPRRDAPRLRHRGAAHQHCAPLCREGADPPGSCGDLVMARTAAPAGGGGGSAGAGHLEQAQPVNSGQFAAHLAQAAAHAADPQIARKKALVGDLVERFGLDRGLAALLQRSTDAGPATTGGPRRRDR